MPNSRARLPLRSAHLCTKNSSTDDTKSTQNSGNAISGVGRKMSPLLGKLAVWAKRSHAPLAPFRLAPCYPRFNKFLVALMSRMSSDKQWNLHRCVQRCRGKRNPQLETIDRKGRRCDRGGHNNPFEPAAPSFFSRKVRSTYVHTYIALSSHRRKTPTTAPRHRRGGGG